MFNAGLYAELLKSMEQGETVAMVTVIATKGSAPGKTGFKMLVYPSGAALGTVGGGLIEAQVTKDALAAISEKKSRVCNYTLDRDKAGGIGMVCGGEASVFIDVIATPETLLIVGAGHIAQPLAAMAAVLGFRVVVMDDRQDFCNKERFPGAAQCLVGDIGELLAAAEIMANTYVVIITRGHAYDRLALEQTINSGAAYVGMIGSKKKVKTVYEELRQKGIAADSFARVYAPVGLEIGAQTAEEIAVSILAQIIAHKYGKGKKHAGDNTGNEEV